MNKGQYGRENKCTKQVVLKATRSMLEDMTEVDWTHQSGRLLYDVAAMCEDEGDYALIKNIRLVCKSWLAAANDSRRLWRPTYRSTSQRIQRVAATFPSLEQVNLSACLHSGDPIDLEPLLHLGGMKSLHAGNFAIHVPTRSSRALEQLTNLVDLNFCPLGTLGLLKLTQLCCLTSLGVRGPEIFTSPSGGDCYENETTAQEVLQQAKDLSRLQSISLSRLVLNEAACRAIACLTQLKSLHLSEAMHTAYVQPVTGDDKATASLAALESICRLAQLQALAMPGSLVYLTNVLSISRLSSLTTLDLQGVAAAQSLSGIEALTGLVCLNVSDMICVPDLSPVRVLTNLRELRFARCIDVQSWGVQAISMLTKLELLDMHMCAFSSSWITLVTGLTNLQFLDMSVGNWRDQDVLQLTACTALSFLGLRDCPSTTSSMHRILKERLPLLSVIEAQCSTSGDQYAGFLGWPY